MASEYLKWKYRDVKPDEPIQHTKKQLALNWWHYHKWWLLVGAVLLFAAINIGYHALGIGEIKPDYQFAYVASVPLNDETIVSLEAALANLGEDCNGDGRVTVQINSYVDMAVSQESDALQYAAAAKVRLMVDMESCESYFFICDDFETLHANYDILSRSDGEIAGASDAVAGYLWENCPQLADLAVGQDEMAGLYIARRGFWENKTCQYKEECDALWDKLTEGVES